VESAEKVAGCGKFMVAGEHIKVKSGMKQQVGDEQEAIKICRAEKHYGTDEQAFAAGKFPERIVG